MLLFVLIPVAWLMLATLVVAICRMAAHGDAMQQLTAEAGMRERERIRESEGQELVLRAPLGSYTRPVRTQSGQRRQRPPVPVQHGSRLHKVV
jgi:hypothetical protein